METKIRVTGCIKDRFAVLIKTDTNGITEAEAENYAHICAVALDYIGAGKIKSGECHDLMVKALNAEFDTENDIIAYIENIRAPRKTRVMSEDTKKKNDAKFFLKRGYNTKQVADFVGLDEAIVIEIARKLKD